VARERTDLFLADLVATRAERNPDFQVLTFECAEREDEVRTFAELHERGNRLAAHLIERGLERGDRFALMMRNHPEFVEAMIAASITGTVFVPIDPRTRGEKLAYTLQNSGSRAAVIADYNLGQLAEVRDGLPDLGFVLALESGEDDAPSVADLADVDSLDQVLNTPAATVDVRLESPSDPFQIIYTSGTTGDPKGVVMEGGRYGVFAIVGRAVFGLNEDDKLYTGLSLTHGNAQAVTLASAICLELPAVISRRFTRSRLWDICRKHGCTTFSLLGGMAIAIYSEPPRPDDSDNPVRMVTSAGMPAAISWSGTRPSRADSPSSRWVTGRWARSGSRGPGSSSGFSTRTTQSAPRTSRARSARVRRAESHHASSTTVTRTRRRRRRAVAGCAAATSATGTRTAGCSSITARGAESGTTATSSIPASSRR
jgi:crotonobetaine/carnitine-CoA ligase